MKRLSKSPSMPNAGKNARNYRLMVEKLEDRLPPGDTLLGALIGWSLLDETSFSSFPKSNLGTPVRETPFRYRSEAIDETESSESAIRVVHRFNAESPFLAARPESSEGVVALNLLTPSPSLPTQPAKTLARTSNSLSLSLPTPVEDSGRATTYTPINVAGADERVAPVESHTPSRIFRGVEDSAPATDVATGFSTPFFFEQNMGQADESFDFAVRAPGYTLGVSATEMVIALPNDAAFYEPEA